MLQGALTHGDRRATEVRDLSQYNIDTKYGRTALTSVMNAVLNKVAPLVPPPQDYKGDFFKGKYTRCNFGRTRHPSLC